MAHAAFVRSDRAHALIRSIDVSDALLVPGVIGAFTAADVHKVARPLRATNASPGYRECDTPILAVDKVRTTGETVVLVVAENRYAAEDGCEAVRIDWEPLPALLSIDDALADGAPAIHDEVPGNCFNEFTTTTGDLEAPFAIAEHVVELEVRQQRYGAAAMEGRVVLADYDVREHALTAWLSTQTPHLARTGLALALGVAETRVRVIAPDVGGGFGPKCILYPEDVAIAAASRILGRPVKWTSDRRGGCPDRRGTSAAILG